MTETQILGFATSNAPNSRTVAGSERFELLALEATYDGSGAGGDFVPAVQIVSDAGVTVGTFPLASTLVSGDSATITWAPFLRNGVGLTGIFYDIINNGGSLTVNTTSGDIQFEASGFLNLFSDTGEVRLKALGTNAEFFLSHNGNITARIGSGRTFTLLGDLGNSMLQMTDGSPNLHIPVGGSVIADL